jgi:ubiquinone/menaquinone biosynthesis C-methylase UbiE
MSGQPDLKRQVKAHWESETCGTRYGEGECEEAQLLAMERVRYELEPWIRDLANFDRYKGQRVLEIGVGGGVDHLQWYKAGGDVFGIDLTDAAISMTKKRLQMHGFSPSQDRLKTDDAENLAFGDESFDLVYSYGVLHHSPNTVKALSEAYRVLKPNGTLKAMVYHHPSWVAVTLYILQGLLKGKFYYPLKQVVFDHLESPGTKTYTLSEMKTILEKIGFVTVNVRSKLSVGDLMTMKLSGKYQSSIYRTFYKLYPRWLVRLCGDRFGLNLFIIAKK